MPYFLVTRSSAGSSQPLPSQDFCGTAALPLKPDIARRGWHGRKVPQADMAPYSITSLALCALQERKSKNRKDRRPLFPMLRRSRALGDFRGVSAMQAIDAGRPLRGWMLQQRGAVVLQIQRQLHL